MLNQEFDELEQSNSEKKLFYKKLSIKAGIFCGILAVFFGLLVTFTLLGRKSWKTGLAKEIEEVFVRYSYSEYSVGDYVKLDSTISVNCAAYKIKVSSKKESDSYAVILRVPTLYGPVGAVYVYEAKKSNAQFVGFAQINENLEESIKGAALNSQIKYWAGKIPQIMATAKEGKK